MTKPTIKCVHVLVINAFNCNKVECILVKKLQQLGDVKLGKSVLYSALQRSISVTRDTTDRQENIQSNNLEKKGPRTNEELFRNVIWDYQCGKEKGSISKQLEANTNLQQDVP